MITGALETELVLVFQALCLLPRKFESGYRCVLTLPAEAVPAQSPSPLQLFLLFSTFTFPLKLSLVDFRFPQNHLAPRTYSNPLTTGFAEQSLEV